MSLLLVMLAAAPGPALSSHDPQSVVAHLQAEGYRAKLDANADGKDPSVGPFIQTQDSGTNITISFLNCTARKKCADVSFSSAWDYDNGKGPQPSVMHKWNAEKRFTKAYLDKEGDPVLEMDLLFTDGKLDPQTFSNAMAIYTDSLGDFEKVIAWDRSAAEPTPAAAPAASR